MKTSEAGLKFIEEFEGCKLSAYPDQGGVWTIGVGHTRGVKEGMTCSEEQALAWLAEDVLGAEKTVKRQVTVALSQTQFDALVSFAFNIGSIGPTMLKCINAGDLEGAAKEFPRWSHIGKVKVAGLLRRRLAEQKLFQEGSYGE